ncbi:MAG: hypothetical protein E7426_05625 [Ruminococcaceae bacterium]|nr:hypothetical protein [Oscillospiraceae bacterium]
MASIYGTAVNGWQLRLDYTVSQDAAAGTSALAVTLYICNGTGRSYNENADSCYYTIAADGNSSKVYNPYNYPAKGWYTLGSRAVTVTHRSDGTGSVTLAGTWHSGFVSSYTPAELSVSGAVTLPAIPRASTLAAPGTLTMGAAKTLTIRRADSGFTHTLTYRFGAASGTVAAGTAAASLSWTPPASLGAQIPSAASGTVTFTLQTYSGGALIGTTERTAVLQVPAYAPTASLAFTAAATAGDIVNANAVVDDWRVGGDRVAVKGFSRLHYRITGATSYGASITGYQAVIAGTGQTLTAREATSAVLTAANGAVKVRVKDSRGKWSAYVSRSVTVYDYAHPSLTASDAFRCDSGGAPSDTGSYLRVLCAGSVSPVGGCNSRTVRERHRAAGGGWSAWTALTDSTAKTVNAGLSATASYEVELSVTDALGHSASTRYQIPTASVTLHLRAGGGGAAFGKYAEYDGALDCGDWSVMGRVLGLGRARAAVPAGADLDGYTEPGVYGVTSGTTAQSLAHCPSSNAGTLRVWIAGGSAGLTYLVQEYVTRLGASIRRSTADGGATWTGWETLATRGWVEEAVSDAVSAALFGPGTALAGTETLTALAPGRYEAASGAVAAALRDVSSDNCPTASNFALWVYDRVSAPRRGLLLLDAAGGLYLRQQSGASAWTGWKRFTGAEA